MWHTSGFTAAAACPRWGYHFTVYSLRLAKAMVAVPVGSLSQRSAPPLDCVCSVHLLSQIYWTKSDQVNVIRTEIIALSRLALPSLTSRGEPRARKGGGKITLLYGPRSGRTSGFTTIFRARGVAHLGLHHSRRVPQVGTSR